MTSPAGADPVLLVRIPLRSSTGAAGTEGGANLLQDALWAHARPPHALEHVRVRPQPRGMHVALFVRAADPAAAAHQAYGLLALALAAGAARGHRPGPPACA
ncbi:hypothetical protein ACGFXC_35495 [Streptomyces sp. NPDC048507]|uniref:hypothetical protein n=1 Tax=Streptomyces sp. NPDC048507 TaxID=3365560 RepID=UPI003713915E